VTLLQLFIAENAGFCFGVKNAIKTVEELINKGESAYTLGELIHNPQVVEMLKQKGIRPSNLEDINEGTLIIRTHGVNRDLIEMAKSKGLNIIDATCPFVKKVHQKALEISNKGYMVIIIGDPHHPEVQGIQSWSGKDVKVIETPEDARNFFTNKKVGVVVQTTQTEENVQQIMEILKQKIDIEIFYNTRCNATKQRQESAANLAVNMDVMIVVGGKNSANTKKLATICRNIIPRVYHIETSDEIKKEWFQKNDKVGITAGASTPDWILKEVVLQMEEISNEFNRQEGENLQNEDKVIIEQTQNEVPYEFTDINEDTVVEGTVVKVSENEVLVNVGHKSDGIIPLNELSNEPFESPTEIVNVGDKINVYILKLEDKEGNLLLSKKRADAILVWDDIEKAFKNNEIVEGTVKSVVKGGLLANIKGITGFIPASHIDLKYVADLNVYTGQKLQFKVIELDKAKNRIVLSRKEVLKEEKERLKEHTWANIQEGQVIKGIVRRLTDFGAFVDIGGIDGLIHISDMSWQKINHPSEVVKENDEVEVKVLKVDKERGRISLGLKQVMPTPWDNIDSKYKEGSIVTGKVVNLVSFGAFVELEPGLEGLVHISQISKEHIPTPHAVLNVGDEVKVKILKINKEDKKLSLSIREAQEQEKQPEPTDNDTVNYIQKNDTITIGDMIGDVLIKRDSEEK